MERSFVENFALAEDRSKLLTQLIPGSEDYDYYHCLVYHQCEQFDRIEPLLAAWLERHGRTERYLQIANRHALLSYRRDHRGCLDYLRRQLELHFDHQPEVAGCQGQYPSRLEPALWSRSALKLRALSEDSDLSGFTDAALPWLAAESLDEPRRHELLERLVRPDVPQLVGW